MLNFYKKILAGGLHTTNDLQQRLQIKFINIAVFIGSLFNVFLAVVNIYEQLYWQAAINLTLIFLIFFPALILNHSGNLTISKALIFYPVTILIFLASILNPGENREFNLIGFAIVGLFIYNKKFGLLAFFYCATLFFTIFYLTLIDSGTVTVREVIISTISYAGIFVAEYFVITFYKNNLLEASITIQRHNKTLQRHNDIKSRNTAQMENTNAWLIRLLSILSHDLKSPINSIKGSLQLYTGKNISASEWENMLPALNQKLNKTEDLIEKLLMWTRIQLNGVKINKKMINWENEVNFLIDELEQNLKQKNLTIQFSNQASQLIYTDKTILYILLRNLLTNAIKFSYVDGVIKISSVLKKNDVCISIKDNGKGMNEEVKNSLFSHNQIKGTGTQNEAGNGIGLIICKELIDKMGGSLEVDSEEGSGTVFMLKLHEAIQSYTIPGKPSGHSYAN